MKNLLSGAPLYYPSAKEWMWNYCIYLGPFISEDGNTYDLGIYLGDKQIGPSAAIVYGNDPGKYISGQLTDHPHTTDYYLETIKRAKLLNLI
jgi:hypothetical protein